MDDEKRVQGFLSLYNQQMERFRDTRGIEWKANFGVWTLLAGAIYSVAVAQHPIHIPFWVALAICPVTVIMHAWWLLKIHHSQQFDKKLWVDYRERALLLLRGGPSPFTDENTWERNRWQEFSWLLVEVWLTVVLSVILVFLTRR